MKTALLLLLAFAANTFAAVQSSTNYTVLADVVDAGGLHSTSASYSNDGSVGGFGGLVTASAPQETARVGYAGQLYEVTAFTLAAASTNLNEATSMPLDAAQFLDDGTVSPANSFARWSFTGPIAGVNTAGIVTAANVYQDTPAVVQASLEGWSALLNLTVINVGNDDYGIYANDGIPDLWQVQYFGTNNPAGTGPIALFAYAAGLNPTNPADVFTLNLSPVPDQSDWQAVIFSPRYTNRTYVVEYSDSLNNGSFTALTNALVSDASTTRTVVDTNAYSNSRFYRVRISYP